MWAYTYVEFAQVPRPINVIYDRSHSAVTQLALPDAASRITPALSDSCYESTLAAKKATEKGVTMSFDVNDRSKLWSPAEAEAKLKVILEHVDILID